MPPGAAGTGSGRLRLPGRRQQFPLPVAGGGQPPDRLREGTVGTRHGAVGRRVPGAGTDALSDSGRRVQCGRRHRLRRLRPGVDLPVPGAGSAGGPPGGAQRERRNPGGPPGRIPGHRIRPRRDRHQREPQPGPAGAKRLRTGPGDRLPAGRRSLRSPGVGGLQRRLRGPGIRPADPGDDGSGRARGPLRGDPPGSRLHRQGHGRNHRPDPQGGLPQGTDAGLRPHRGLARPLRPHGRVPEAVSAAPAIDSAGNKR